MRISSENDLLLVCYTDNYILLLENRIYWVLDYHLQAEISRFG